MLCYYQNTSHSLLLHAGSKAFCCCHFWADADKDQCNNQTAPFSSWHEFSLSHRISLRSCAVSASTPCQNFAATVEFVPTCQGGKSGCDMDACLHQLKTTCVAAECFVACMQQRAVWCVVTIAVMCPSAANAYISKQLKSTNYTACLCSQLWTLHSLA